MLAALLCACESTPTSETRGGYDPSEASAVFGPAPAYSQPPDTHEWEDEETLDPEAMTALREQALRDMGISIGGPAATTRATSRATSRTDATEAARPEPNSGAGERWTIGIATFGGPNGRAMAEEGLRRVQTRAGLTRAYLKQKGLSWIIAYGAYEDASDDRAQRDLRRVQEMEIDGGRPFAQAVLMPPEVSASRGRAAAHDLRHVRSRYGPDALYTLQIGAYGKIEGVPSASERKEIRASAEQAAGELRQQGELAFFYHAPNRSMVTVGVLTAEDHDPETGLDSMRLRALREAHPHNLFNGGGIRESAKTRAGGKASRLQPSILVAIPEG